MLLLQVEAEAALAEVGAGWAWLMESPGGLVLATGYFVDVIGYEERMSRSVKAKDAEWTATCHELLSRLKSSSEFEKHGCIFRNLIVLHYHLARTMRYGPWVENLRHARRGKHTTLDLMGRFK